MTRGVVRNDITMAATFRYQPLHSMPLSQRDGAAALRPYWGGASDAGNAAEGIGLARDPKPQGMGRRAGRRGER